MSQIAENVAMVRERIRDAARSAGREQGEILLVAATKMNDAGRVRQAVEAGVDACGENRVQEILEKLPQGAYAGKPLHFIGHLQRNKVKNVVGTCDLIQSVDSAELLDLIGRRAAAIDLVQKILLEVNIGREPAKSGVLPEQLDRLLDHAAGIGSIAVCGLMAIPPISAFPGGNIQYFEAMYNLFIDIKGKKYDNISMQLLSMGMSDDYTDAIACGANMVRVGAAIFGARGYH
jgi:pyridoxal phosphate enzyme (YggS family)